MFCERSLKIILLSNRDKLGGMKTCFIKNLYDFSTKCKVILMKMKKYSCSYQIHIHMLHYFVFHTILGPVVSLNTVQVNFRL